jgi:hypothetical protein
MNPLQAHQKASLREFIRDKCVRIAPAGELFTFASGRKGKVKFDLAWTTRE